MENTNIPVPQNTLIKSLHEEHPKKVKLIIFFAILLLIVLIALYLLNKNKKPVKVYTPQEKADQMEEVLNKTKEQGLPPVKTQLDIMKLNAQE